MGETETPLAAGRRMLDIFASVGAGHFHVTWTNGEAQPRRARSLRQSLAALGGPLPHADNPDWLDAIHIGPVPTVTLVANSPADQAAGWSAAKRETRVLATEMPANHSATRTKLIAAAVITCWRCVLARPM
jgi:hypothetical protein